MIARWLVSVFGALFACLGAWIVFDPRGLIAFAELFLTPGGLWFAVVLRVAVGTLLWICASASRTPIVFRILGTLFILSGIALPFVGLDRFLAIAEWGSSQDDLLLRGMGLLTAALGAFFVWSAAPRKGDA
jgi:hypothetical protein